MDDKEIFLNSDILFAHNEIGVVYMSTEVDVDVDEFMKDYNKVLNSDDPHYKIHIALCEHIVKKNIEIRQLRMELAMCQSNV